MEIDWNKVRRVVLDDRWRKCYKPDRTVINKIVWELPDCRIIGFSFYPVSGFWCLLVEDGSFSDNPFGIIRDVSVSKLHTARLHLLPSPTKGWFS